jgi:cytochrome c553
VRGRLELRDGLQAHQLSEKEKALADCKVCHQQGAAPFQSVVLSIAGADGRPLRADVKQDVLSSLTALESVRGFYAIGSTRIKLLDWLMVLAVAGTIAGCLAHAVARRMTRGLRERLAAEAKAAAEASMRAAGTGTGS